VLHQVPEVVEQDLDAGPCLVAGRPRPDLGQVGKSEAVAVLLQLPDRPVYPLDQLGGR
jgi:hypothetical protein